MATGLHPLSLPLALPSKPGGWLALPEGTVIMLTVSFLKHPDYFFERSCLLCLQEPEGPLHSLTLKVEGVIIVVDPHFVRFRV